MKVVVIGGNGQLGTDVVQAFRTHGDEAFSITHDDMELAMIDSVAKPLRTLRPDLIVNTAALHHVETCERDPALAFAVNAIGARNVGTMAEDLGSRLIHVSTDYVFDGSKSTPYDENDIPLPLNVYGNSKLAGECFVRSIAKQHVVLRVSGLYGVSSCRGKGGLNFVELMLKLGTERGKVRVVDTEEVSPTSTFELARQMVFLSRTDASGLFHATAEGSCTWYEFAKEIFATSGLSAQVEAAKPGEFPAKVPRPSYSVLENSRLKSLGLNRMGEWQEGLRRYIGVLREQRAVTA